MGAKTFAALASVIGPWCEISGIGAFDATQSLFSSTFHAYTSPW